MTATDEPDRTPVAARRKQRAVMLFALTAVIALLLTPSAYLFRPDVQARAGLTIDDSLLPALTPGLPGSPVDSAVTTELSDWLRDTTIASDHAVTIEGDRIIVIARDREPGRAAEGARKAAERLVAALAAYRAARLEPFEPEAESDIRQPDAMSAVDHANDRQRLFKMFEAAMIEAKAEAHDSKALARDLNQSDQAGAGGVKKPAGGNIFLESDAPDLPRPHSIPDAVPPRERMDQAEALRQELARLRANAPFDSTDISALAATRVASVEGRPNATAREAWIRPAARLSGSVTTTDQPFWAKLPVVIGESSILALFGAILLTALYEAFLLNRDDADTEGDQDHFSDPYWPAKIASPTAADGMDSMDH